MTFASLVHRIKRKWHRLRFLHGVETIGSVAKLGAGFDAMLARVRAAGTDSRRVFGEDYAAEGGLCLQQNTREFAALLCLLVRRKPIRHYLEIGTASGGTCKMLHEAIGFESIISLDDGKHPRAALQKESLAGLPNFRQFLGDSHSPAAGEFMAREVAPGSVDVAFVDGDHSAQGVTMDVALIRPYVRRGGWIILHDTVACDGVEAAWMGLSADPAMRPVAEFIGPDHAMGIAVAEVQ